MQDSFGKIGSGCWVVEVRLGVVACSLRQDSKDESPALCVAQMKKLDNEDNEVLAAVEPSQETAKDKAPSPSTETRKLQDEDSQKLAPSVPSQEAENGGEQESFDSDDEFHSAFMAEMRRLHGEDRQKLNTSGPSGQAMPEWSKETNTDFEASAKFLGARPGFVFKRGRRGLGYYRDLGPFHDPSQERAQASGVLPDFRRSRKAKRPLEEVDGEVGEQEADEAEEDMEETRCWEDPDEAEAMDTADAAKAEAAEGQGETGTEKVVETKKEKRRKRREAKEAEAKAKAEAAKKRARDGFGEGDGDWMDSDPDRSEQSSEEQMESYFDLVKRYTTKKTLPTVDHDKIEYKSFRKNLYVQVKEITNLKDHEVADLRRTHGDITVRGKRCPHPVTSFLQCGLPDKIMKIMEKRDYEKPFPIQMQAIPALMCGRDVIGVAQTGSGKTLAYLLPLIRHILDQPKLGNGDGPIGFVVAPTRELALQIQREASTFYKAVHLISVCAYGGGPMGEQLSALKKGAELLVGTPGRLIDVLTTSGGKITNLRRVTFLVLDEADRMFDMGFEPQIGMFLQSTRPDKQVAMFSATLPAHVEALARKVLKKPLEISVGEKNTAASNVTQFVEVLDESQKFYRLLQLLGEWHEHGAIMIFDVDEMFTELLKYGYPPLALHGGQDQQDRDFTLQDFKDGISNILIATSVAARGIDVKNVILVVNFKVPDHLEDYIHRIGRTGRAGKPGFAYTFIQPDEADRAQDGSGFRLETCLVATVRTGSQPPVALECTGTEEHQTAVNTGQAADPDSISLELLFWVGHGSGSEAKTLGWLWPAALAVL
eukprot:s5539_g1.t2